MQVVFWCVRAYVRVLLLVLFFFGGGEAVKRPSWQHAHLRPLLHLSCELLRSGRGWIDDGRDLARTPALKDLNPCGYRAGVDLDRDLLRRSRRARLARFRGWSERGRRGRRELRGRGDLAAAGLDERVEVVA